MWEIPYAAGLQILDADSFARGIPRVYTRSNEREDFDALAEIERILKTHKTHKSHNVREI
jgi:hypothetical protein